MLFRIKPDSSLTARWALGSPTIAGNELDPRRFTSGEVYEGPIAGLRVPVTVDGARTACTFGAFDMPIVNAGVHGSMVGVGGIQWVPIQVGDSRDELFIMNALSVVDCIDTERTIGHKWMAASGRPEKVGQYRGIVKLALDEGRAGNSKLFRLAGWRIALIADQVVVERLRVVRHNGLEFELVS
jgi:hypothetical protein